MKPTPKKRSNLLVWSGGMLTLGIGWVGMQLVGDGGRQDGLHVNVPAQAAESDYVEGDEHAMSESEEENTVRLSFFNATWPTILRKVAEETNSELVMKRAPAGRLTRADRRRYSRTDAVRLLNQEMESKGFRLLEQGKFLVVLHLDSLRTRYQRPTMPAQEPEETKNELLKSGTWQNHTMQPRVVRAGHESEATAEPLPMGAPGFSDEPPGRHELDRPAEPGLLAPIVVATRNRGAKNVALDIYSALKPRAELIHDGPGHLPAFQVFQQNADGRLLNPNRGRTVAKDVQFAIGIDVERDELVVTGSRDQQQHLVQMIRALDAPAKSPSDSVRLVASRHDAVQLARNIRPAINMMMAQNQRGRVNGFLQQPADNNQEQNNQPNGFDPQPNNQPDNPNLQPGDEQPGNQQPAPGSVEQGQQPGNQPLFQVQGLRGPVSIQEVPGVGLVITGNDADVKAVIGLLRELERLAAGTIPKIDLLRLRYVNSEALATLLSTVYEQLTTIRGTAQRSQAAIIPVVKPNAVLVIAAPADLETIAELADGLDEPVNPRDEFQVFPLKNAVATQVVETLNTLYGGAQQGQQQQATTGLSTRIRAVSDIRTNTVIVQAAPRDLEEVAIVIRRLDGNPSAVTRMKVFPLKNAVADELSEVMNSAIQSVLGPAQTTGGQGFQNQQGQQGSQRLSDAKSVVLEFLTEDAGARRVLRSGVLADIRVSPDVRVNSLIVTAPEQSMPLIEELIRQLDQPTSNVAEIKVFTLKNSDAGGMAELLETLLATDDAQVGVQLADAADASSGLIPLRFSVDVRTNSIIAIGGAEALRVVEAILLRLDETDIRQRKTTVYKLKNSPAQGIADAVNLFLQAQRDLATIDPELVSNVELLEREIIVEPEPVSNSLLVSATPRYYEEVIGIIEKLDEAPAQVVIQVLIVEVLLDNTDEFGVELGFQDSLLFDRGLIESFDTITTTVSDPVSGIQTSNETIINQVTQPGFLFNNQALGNNTAIRPGSVGTQGLSNFSLGRVNGDLGFGGLVLSASSESISVLVRALASQRNVHVLSRPQIRTVDNQLAQIQVGQQVPVIQGVNTNALGGISPALGTPQQVGIILQVTPRITPDGIVVMETIANKSAFAGQGVPIFVDPTTGNAVESPIFDLTEAQATIAVPDGQTVVLGGMITKTDDTLERKVPWLGDIPILGTAFRYDATQSRRTELLIFMTPRIIRNAADSELIKQVESERTHMLEDLVEEVHGPIYAVPPAMPFEGFPGSEIFPGSPSIPPGDLMLQPIPADGHDVPTTIMPGNVPPPPMPGSSFRPFPEGEPFGDARAGRRQLNSGYQQQTLRGSAPRKTHWWQRLPRLW